MFQKCSNNNHEATKSTNKCHCHIFECICKPPNLILMSAPHRCLFSRASIHKAGGRLVARFREVSKPRDSVLTFSTALKFDRHLDSSARKMSAKIERNTIKITSNLIAWANLNMDSFGFHKGYHAWHGALSAPENSLYNTKDILQYCLMPHHVRILTCEDLNSHIFNCSCYVEPVPQKGFSALHPTGY